MISRRRALVVAGVGAALTGAAAAAAIAERAVVRTWRADADALIDAERTLPGDLRQHFVTVSDGGRIHAVERGTGDTIVFLHGITSATAIWAPQLRALGVGHRVVSIDFRGHGLSSAGHDGFPLHRLADDVLEVLVALEVRDAVLVGHSMGSMVTQLLALDRTERLRRHVRALVLVATSAGPLVPAPLTVGSPVVRGGSELVRLSLSRARHQGRGSLGAGHGAAWANRLAFGRAPRAVDLELCRSTSDSTPSATLAALLPELIAFDVHRRSHEITVPTTIVAGTWDLLTPVRHARAIARRIPGASLVEYEGCGHMVMLERDRALIEVLEATVRGRDQAEVDQ